jgi:hypothetical protein
MACVTSGLTNPCTLKKTGGSKQLHIANKQDIDSISQDPTGEVTAVTMLLTNTFFKVEFAANQSSFNESVDANGQVTQVYTFVSESRYQAQRNFIQNLIDCGCGITVIHTENTGLSKFWGYEDTEEAFLLSAEGTTGTAKSDPNQETIVLQALATIKANDFTGTIPV